MERLILQGSVIHHGPDFPTFYGHRSRTTPDLVLSNNKVHHNITITPGPLTESDHLPIIMTITDKAIMKNIPPILKMKGAQWDTFKEEINSNIANITVGDNINKN